MNKKIINLVLVLSLLPVLSVASESHESKAKENDHDDHEHKEKTTDKHEEEVEHEEANTSVGNGKGIIEVSADGFKLSPEAIKTISYKSIKIESDQFFIHKKYIMYSKGDKKLYRLRNGFIKSVDFSILNSIGETFKAQSKEFKKGDELIISSIGHIRVAELVALGGNAVGHSH